MVMDHIQFRLWAEHGTSSAAAGQKAGFPARKPASRARGSREIAGVLSALLLSGLTLGIALGPSVVPLA